MRQRWARSFLADPVTSISLFAEKMLSQLLTKVGSKHPVRLSLLLLKHLHYTRRAAAGVLSETPDSVN
jgi:hypothetical protein